MFESTNLPQSTENYHNRSEKQIQIFREIARLDSFGFALHWLRPNSKAPVESEWSKSPRHSLEDLKSSYRHGYGLGVVLGKKSQLADGSYLANIDIDTKDMMAHSEAINALNEMFPGLYGSGTPTVKTGNGLRLLVKTSKPYGIKTLIRSDRKVTIHMPNDTAKTFNPEFLTQEEFDAGYRARPAFEISFLGEGAQAVLPPSIHPDTGLPYQWSQPIHGIEDIEYLESELLDTHFSESSISREPVQFQFVEYDLSRLQPQTIEKIQNGVPDSSDESRDLFGLMSICWNAGYSEDEIMSIFLDRENAMGGIAYRHAKTTSPMRAARWLKRYNLDKIVNRKKESFGEIDDNLIEQMLKNHQESKELLKDQKQARGKDGKFKKKTKGSNIARLPGIEYNKYGKILPVGGNASVLIIPLLEGIIGYDMFERTETYLAAPEWHPATKIEGFNDENIEAGTPTDIALLRAYVSKIHSVWFQIKDVQAIITTTARQYSFHPVIDELNNLPPWDGTPRIDTWLRDYFGATQDPVVYTGDVFRKWLVGSIKRTFQPGCQFDWMIILEGKMGLGKSTFIKKIAGERFYKKLTVVDISKSRDVLASVNAARILDFDELGAMQRSTVEAMKTFLTSERDDVRQLFTDNKLLKYKRQCVCIGSTNATEYLKDDTGNNRRFNPIKVGRLDRKQLELDRDQLWAEAYHLYKTTNEFLDLTGEAEDYANFIRRTKMVLSEVDVIIETIVDHFHSKKGQEFNYDRFRVRDLFKVGGPLCLDPLSFTSKTPMHWQMVNAGKALTQLNAKKSVIKGYSYHKLTSENIETFKTSKTWKDNSGKEFAGHD